MAVNIRLCAQHSASAPTTKNALRLKIGFNR